MLFAVESVERRERAASTSRAVRATSGAIEAEDTLCDLDADNTHRSAPDFGLISSANNFTTFRGATILSSLHKNHSAFLARDVRADGALPPRPPFAPALAPLAPPPPP